MIKGAEIGQFELECIARVNFYVYLCIMHATVLPNCDQGSNTLAPYSRS